MQKRFIVDSILAALSDTPVVFIQGPRQSGKTTLVQNLGDQGFKAPYITLDDGAALTAAQHDPDAFISGLPDSVIIDEVQRAPELFPAIKSSVDKKRRPGRFLLTGSANALLLPKLSESLAGRMEILPLWPFSQGEISGRQETFIDFCFGKKIVTATYAGSDWPSLAEKIMGGGYPEPLTRKTPMRRQAWFNAYLTTILERDVRDIANIQGLKDLPRLLRLVATRSAGLLNLAGLSRDAALPQTTLQRYLALLEITFMLRTIPAWSRNLGTRLVKAPKLMVSDSGLLCHLLGMDAARLKTEDLLNGAVLETFVTGELIKQIAWSETRPALFHYRTHTQQEVDVILESPDGRLVGVEIKKTSSPNMHDFKGLIHFAEQAKKQFLRGILLYTGEKIVSFGQNLHAVPISALWQKAV